MIIITRRLYRVEWTQYSIRSNRSAICNRRFLGPTRVVDTNDISIASAVFAGLTRWQTDWQTDRPRYSVGNNSRSAQWSSQILLLSTATTGIYWNSVPNFVKIAWTAADMVIFRFFQFGGRPPSWICSACVGTTYEGHLVVFYCAKFGWNRCSSFDNMCTNVVNTGNTKFPPVCGIG